MTQELSRCSTTAHRQLCVTTPWSTPSHPHTLLTRRPHAPTPAPPQPLRRSWLLWSRLSLLLCAMPGRAHPPCSQAPTGPRPSTRPALEALWGLRTHHRGDRHHSSPWKTSTWNSSSEYLGSDLHATPTLLKRDCMTECLGRGCSLAGVGVWGADSDGCFYQLGVPKGADRGWRDIPQQNAPCTWAPRSCPTKT